MIVFFILFFLCGYFLYASIYTAIAAPFNSDQEAQQLAMIPMAMIISGVAIYPAVMNNPTGGDRSLLLALPVHRPADDVPAHRPCPPCRRWQILAVHRADPVATTVGIAWFAGRIYRVGILMYGKKPTIPEIFRWVRYSPGKTPAPENVGVA